MGEDHVPPHVRVSIAEVEEMIRRAEMRLEQKRIALRLAGEQDSSQVARQQLNECVCELAYLRCMHENLAPIRLAIH